MYYKEEYKEETSSIEQQYVTELNKPIPSKNHSSVQLNIGFLMKLNYEEKVTI